MKVQTLGAACVLGLLLAGPASAHHSFAMFDGEKTITLSGTVKEMEWTNPHMWIYLMVPDETGKAIEYSLEMQGPGQALRLGWKQDTVKAGDKVTVEIHPLRTGAHGGQLLNVTLASGQKLGVTGKPPSPFGD